MLVLRMVIPRDMAGARPMVTLIVTIAILAITDLTVALAIIIVILATIVLVAITTVGIGEIVRIILITAIETTLIIIIRL